MSPNPVSFVAHLRENGYHPRSDKHSNDLALAIVNDLLDFCPVIAEHATSGELCYSLNFTIRAGTADWNSDLVFGTPPLGTKPPEPPKRILYTPPARVRIGIELKTVMTEHRKAVKNRKRDFEAHHEHVHRYDDQAIAGALLVVNASDRFYSPLRQAEDITKHRKPEDLVVHCLDQLRAVTIRSGPRGVGLDAKCAIVIKHTNLQPPETTFVTKLPAPQVGDPMHYDAFIQSICAHYQSRFSRRLTGEAPPRDLRPPV